MASRARLREKNKGDPGDPMTSAEAAEWLGVTQQKLRYWRARGTGPVYTGSQRQVRYTVGDLLGWITAWIEREG
jgi:Helix-turn-helix domain